MKISETGDLSLLRVSGPLNHKAVEKWERILKENERANGSFVYNILLDEYKVLSELLSEYNVIRAMLILLHYQIDDECIAYLADRNYFVDKKDSVLYAQSLKLISYVSSNYETRIRVKYNEIKAELPKDIDTVVAVTYDDLMAGMMVRGIPVPEDVTLARFNAIKKQWSEQQKRNGNNQETSIRG